MEMQLFSVAWDEVCSWQLLLRGEQPSALLLLCHRAVTPWDHVPGAHSHRSCPQCHGRSPTLLHSSCDHPPSNAASPWACLGFWHLDAHQSLPPPPGSSLQLEWVPPSCSTNGFHPLAPRGSLGKPGPCGTWGHARKPGAQVSKCGCSLSPHT